MPVKIEQLGSKLRKKIRTNWAKLSELDLNDAGKSVSALSAKIQKAYGRSKKNADREIVEFRKALAVERSRTTN